MLYADHGYPSKLGPGDLYINSNGWTASGSGHYATDTFTSAEGWNYVVTQAATGGWGLYSLDFSSLQYTNVSSLGRVHYVYRHQQAWTGGAGTFIGSALHTPKTVGNITGTFTLIRKTLFFRRCWFSLDNAVRNHAFRQSQFPNQPRCFFWVSVWWDWLGQEEDSGKCRGK